jgi:hypothetical protein
VGELCLSFDKCFQCMFLSGDIVVGLQDRLWTASFVAFQRPLLATTALVPSRRV